MNCKRILFVMLALLVTLSAGATWVAAQTNNSGSVSGTVTDPSGAVVPGATVTAKSVARGTTFQATTGSGGNYSFSLLEPGSYSVTVEATGFQKAESTLDVSVSQTTTSNFALSVATAGTTVTVTEAAPLLQSQNGDVSTALSQQQVSQVPNPGNDLSYVAQIAPGAVMNTFGGYGNFSSYGLPATSNLFTLNGMDDNDPFLNLNNSGATNLLLGQNEVQEATVVSNGYSGQFGGLAGANVNYITKSGGNQFHGNAIYYWNGRTMNANSWIDNANAVPRPFDNANQWAGSIGGPIKKDKLFFFFNTEGLRVLLPTGPDLVSSPTPLFQTDQLANLTATGLTASIPFYQSAYNLFNAAPGLSRAVAGQTGQVQTAAQSCTSALSGNTLTGPNGLGTTVPCVQSYFTSPVALTHEWQAAGRFDYNIGNNDQMFFRMQYDTGLQASYTDPISPLFNATSTQPEYQGQILETHTFGPTASNQLLFAGSWYTAIFQPTNLTATLAAFPTTLEFADGSLGSAALFGGENFIWPQGRNVSQAQIQDDYSKTIGRHTVKFGGKWRRNWISDHDFGFFNSGLAVPFTLQDFYAGGNAANVAGGNGGFGDLLEQAFPTSLNQPIASYSLQMYVQDEWRVKPNLTVTVALRGEHFSNPTCLHLCFTTSSEPFYQYTSANPNIVDVPYNETIQTQRKQAVLNLQNIAWEPRVNFAWQPFSGSTNRWTSNFVVRGGFGLFADQFPGSVADNASQNPPNYNTFVPSNNFLSPQETNTMFSANGNLFSDAAANNKAFVTGFAAGETLAQIQAAAPAFSPPGLVTFDSKSSFPMYEKWSLEVQKGFGANTSVSVSYVGNHGYHELVQNTSANAFNSGNFTGLPSNVALDPRFAEVNFITSAGVSNYNGMTTTFQHRFTAWGAQGVFQFNYTWSHAFDEISNGGLLQFNPANSITPENPFNLRDNYGPSDYDVRNYINANYVYELPIKKLLGGHGSDYLTKGWQISGTIFYRTGQPYTVYDGGLSSTLASSNYFGRIIPQFLGGGSPACGSGAAGQAIDPCLSASQFTPAGTETGFTGGLRNFFYGPGYFNTDFTVVKNTKIPGWEKGSLGIGFQFFNLFNHPNFANPVADVSNPSFGQIQSQTNEPTSILGSFLGGNASPRLIQLKASLTF
jgi:hypothetical protein